MLCVKYFTNQPQGAGFSPTMYHHNQVSSLLISVSYTVHLLRIERMSFHICLVHYVKYCLANHVRINMSLIDQLTSKEDSANNRPYQNSVNFYFFFLRNLLPLLLLIFFFRHYLLKPLLLSTRILFIQI